MHIFNPKEIMTSVEIDHWRHLGYLDIFFENACKLLSENNKQSFKAFEYKEVSFCLYCNCSIRYKYGRFAGGFVRPTNGYFGLY